MTRTMEKIALAGAGAPFLKVLHKLGVFENTLSFVGIFCYPDTGPEIKRVAQELNIPIYDIQLLNSEPGINLLREIKIDWFFNINTTTIFSQQFLAIPKRGCLNIHPGLLPEDAGLHMNQWAIRNGELIFGSTLHWMEERIDAGPIALRRRFDIQGHDTGLSVFTKASNIGVELVVEALFRISDEISLPKIPQDLTKRRLYTHNDALNGAIHWCDSAEEIVNLVRALDYYPLHSPTCQATGLLSNRELVALKAGLWRKYPTIPGRILSISSSGLEVGTGHNSSILISKLICPEIGLLSGDELISSPLIELGGQFEVLND